MTKPNTQIIEAILAADEHELFLQWRDKDIEDQRAMYPASRDWHVWQAARATAPTQPTEPSKADVVERVARALWNKAQPGFGAIRIEWEQAGKTNRFHYEGLAGAALSALHPSDEVIAGMGESRERVIEKMAQIMCNEELRRCMKFSMEQIIDERERTWRRHIKEASDLLEAFESEGLALSHSQKHKPVDGWLPIESAPTHPDKKCFLVIGVWPDKNYTTDPWCVFRDADNGFARWPHNRLPTHWQPLPTPPAALKPETTGDVAQADDFLRDVGAV